MGEMTGRNGTGDGLGVGIVGTGRMAATMVDAFRRSGGIAVRAVASRDPARAKAFAQTHGIDATDLDGLLARPDIRVVYVANANVHHAEDSIWAMRAGKAVLCEKPFAVSFQQGLAVLATARTTGQVFLEAMWTPHLPAYRRLFELIGSKAIGEPFRLQASFGYPTSRSACPQLFAPGPGGGVLLDRGVYLTALAQHLFGPAERVTAEIIRDANGVDVTASLQLGHVGGRVSQLECSFEILSANTGIVSGTAGQVRLLAPLVGAGAVSHARARVGTPSSGAPSAGGAVRSVKRALQRLSVLHRVRALLDGTTEYFDCGPSPHSPLLRDFAALVQRPNAAELARLQAISLESLRIVDLAGTRSSTHQRALPCV